MLRLFCLNDFCSIPQLSKVLGDGIRNQIRELQYWWTNKIHCRHQLSYDYETTMHSMLPCLISVLVMVEARDSCVSTSDVSVRSFHEASKMPLKRGG